MLSTLEIRDMLIIDRLELSFQPGLNVLTGETGAGKSILLDSLGFVLGWRGRAELVRQGAAQGEVVAVFDLPEGHPAFDVLQEAGLPVSDELILRRVNTAEGRKTAWVNDRRVSGEVLRALSATLIELHGQQDDRGLLNPRVHREMLDGYGALEKPRATVQTAWRALAEARKTAEATRESLSQLRAEEEFLRHAVGELDALSPEPGEDAELDARRRQMQGAEKIRDDVARVLGLLGHEGAESQLGEAARWLDSLAEDVPEEAAAALSRALVELGEAHDVVERYLESLQFDPAELERTEERLFAIRALARKHDVLPDELGDHAQELRARLSTLDAGDAGLAQQEEAVTAAAAAYDKAAQTLRLGRQKAAKRLDKAVMAELAPLKMERAVFRTELFDAEPGPEGMDAVTFTAATNPGAPAGAINKVASGGELSRFLLALKVCLSDPENRRSMIFDEIDRGIGGATADAVGRRLLALSEGGQVLVVTHSPQVAALGGHHWQVQKSVKGNQTLSTVVPLPTEGRIDEIARMLAGDTVTPEARNAAKALLEG